MTMNGKAPTTDEKLAALQGQIDLLYRRHEEQSNRIAMLECVIDDMQGIDGDEPIATTYMDGSPVQ